jgi:hypothetical protein
MTKFSTLRITALLVFSLCSCDIESKKENNEVSVTDTDPAMTPLFKFDYDTIRQGDSLSGIIGAVFKPSITSKQRQELIATISYRLDTTDIELTDDSSFEKSNRLNDSTFRFSILPTHIGLNSITRKSLFAAINVKFNYLDSQKQTYIFRNRFEFYIRK